MAGYGFASNPPTSYELEKMKVRPVGDAEGKVESKGHGT
jgi:hypothetical protein